MQFKCYRYNCGKIIDLFGDGMLDDSLIFAEEEVKADCSGECVSFWPVLVVDDDKEIYEVTQLALNDFCFNNLTLELEYAQSAEQAIEMASKTEYAVLLIDMIMEEEDSGMKVVEHIRQNQENRHSRLIVRSGQPGRMNVDECYAADINEFAHKTELTNDKLKTLVLRHLRDYAISSWYLDQLSEKEEEIMKLKEKIGSNSDQFRLP